ncbi:TPA: disulfide bond formation protein B [Bacillus cereus]|nr:disulfide bond formation protein B [Bacillus cereus]
MNIWGKAGEVVNNRNIVFGAWIITVFSTFGSLFFSEIMGFIPCDLCWYQRILMYPLIIILGIIYINKSYNHIYYVFPFCLLGMMLSGYHYAIQKLSPFLKMNMSCGRIPCTGEYINFMGFITIPFLSFIAFTLLMICMLILKHDNKEEIVQ